MRAKIIHQIKCDLTVGRKDYGLEPFNKLDIAAYLVDNAQGIERTLADMKAMWSPEDMANPENDWVREILYEHVKSNMTEGMEDDEGEEYVAEEQDAD